MSKTVLEKHQEYLFPAVAPLYGDHPIVVSHAKDHYLWDAEGNRYLDFFGGILTVSVGHGNDEVNAAIIEQLGKIQHTSVIYINEKMVELAEKLAQITPGRLQKSFFTNSGSEANETAILAARIYTGHRDIITLRYAYSGRTTTTMSVNGHGNWRIGGVADGYIKHMRAPYLYRAPLGLDEDQLVELCVQDLEEILATVTDGHIAAFVAEPIQGVGGFITPPKSFFKRILPIIRSAGGLFIADEVQTGWGRTGDKWFGIEHWDVEPDIMTFAKGMANGAPIGCTIAIPEVADALRGATFSTFGGNPVTMAAALATIQYIEKNNLPANAARQGAVLRERLDELKSEFPFIGDVRGMGLMQAIEIVQPGTDKTPDPARTNALLNQARENGLLVGRGGRYSNVLRIAPHLNVSAETMEAGCALLAQSIAQIAD
jgi:4-aminobutyrate aminotransferase-like enzyme